MGTKTQYDTSSTLHTPPPCKECFRNSLSNLVEASSWVKYGEEYPRVAGRAYRTYTLHLNWFLGWLEEGLSIGKERSLNGRT